MRAKYAYSIKTSRVKEPDFPYDGQSITCTADLVGFVKSLQVADNEKFIAIYMNAQNRVIGIQAINGIVNQAVVYPREVVRHVLLANASAMILVHNHPSGVVNPSDADIRLTRSIQQVSKFLDILVHDHLIVSENVNVHFSFRENGIMNEE